MHYYLTSPVRQTRPDGFSWSPPIDIAGDWSSLYLLEGDETGTMLVASDHRHRHQLLTYLGDDLDSRSRWMLGRLATRLGIHLQAVTLRGAIAEIMLLHGSYRDHKRWNPLRAHNGWHRIHLRGVVYAAPAVIGATQTEDFTRGADENLEASANWTLNEGTAGALRVIASTDDADSNAENDPAVYKYNSDVSTNDTYCQLELTEMAIGTTSAEFNQVGPMVAVGSSQATGYFFQRYYKDDGGGDDTVYNLRKSDNDSRSDLTSETSLALSLPETLKVAVAAGNLYGFIDDDQKDAVTDTTLTLTKTGGIYTYRNHATGPTYHTIDDWELGDWETSTQVAPNADGTRTNVFKEGGGTTDLYQSVDDDPASPTTSDYIYTDGIDGSMFFDSASYPADFATMRGLRVSVSVDVQNFQAQTCNFYVQVFASDESTAYTDEVKAADQADDGLLTVRVPVNATGRAATKAQWDASRVKLRWDFV